MRRDVGAVLVVASLEDETGQRCVDLRQRDDGRFDWVECRRDPEDAHGWRAVAFSRAFFDSEAAAYQAAIRDVGWLAATVEQRNKA